MPWEKVSTMSLRQEFEALAQPEGINIRDLCRCFGISPKTGDKWVRRPEHSPLQMPADLEALVVAARLTHPA